MFKSVTLHICLLIIPCSVFAQAALLTEYPDVSLEVIEIDSTLPYEFALSGFFKQPLDHRSVSADSILQRINLRHIGFDRPLVLVTDGYDLEYSRKKTHQNELADLLDANLVHVEHRFFGSSFPKSMKWQHLNTWQASTDLHRIVNWLKNFYTNTIIISGISKGGQTALYYNYYYPAEVDGAVLYVTPLNFSTKEPRVNKFLENVGKKSCREKIFNFQKNLLQNKKNLIPVFKEMALENGYSFDAIGGYEAAFEYMVLEYNFAFWQWGGVSCHQIPDTTGSAVSKLKKLVYVTGWDFFSDQGLLKLQSFFYQALTELGFYTYDTTGFSDYLDHFTNDVFAYALPPNTTATFNSELNPLVAGWLQTQAQNMIFIYGAYDSWTASRVNPGKNDKIEVFTVSNGCHSSRIHSLSKRQQKKLLRTINQWTQNGSEPN